MILVKGPIVTADNRLILISAALQGCRGPVHAQFVENWVAYHYFDVTNHRWEMSVLELYNKAQGNVTISDMVFGKTSNSMSSYEPVPVEVTHTDTRPVTACPPMNLYLWR